MLEDISKVHHFLIPETLEAKEQQEMLNNMVREYPYFQPARALLIHQQKDMDEQEKQEALQEAAWHFSNPLWLWELSRNKSELITLPPVKETPIEITTDEDTPDLTEETPDEAIRETQEEETPVVAQEETPVLAQEQTEEVEMESPVIPPFIADTRQAPLVFQAYHTIDYFASQGIKLKQEDLQKDQFGKKLKSFTEWLKILKRVPLSEQLPEEDAQMRKGVEKQAALSIETREIITETMAEVWLKQGNKEKARRIYEKLSLLNPTKSTYFAAKIEKIKAS